MKLLMIATALLVLSGCSKADDEFPDSVPYEQQEQVIKPDKLTVTRIRIDSDNALFMVVDRETGCQYFGINKGYNGSLSITPRMNADGTQMCRKAVAP
jgi:hypothetical protein